jgi:hypothetical protein
MKRTRERCLLTPEFSHAFDARKKQRRLITRETVRTRPLPIRQAVCGNTETRDPPFAFDALVTG